MQKQDQAQELLNNLLQQSPSQVIAWLESVWTGQQQAPEKFNWLGLAEVTAAQARAQGDQAWAQVAIMIYEWLAASGSLAPTDEYIDSAMTLRAYMIGKKGPVPGDPVLDMDYIVRWFFENLPISYEEAEHKAAFRRWRTANIQEIKALRGIKNRLRVIASLVNSGRLQPDQELNAWLSLRDQLP